VLVEKDEDVMISRSLWDDSWPGLVVWTSRHRDGQAIVTDFDADVDADRDWRTHDENTGSREIFIIGSHECRLPHGASSDSA
jgi:hypothetical protein